MNFTNTLVSDSRREKTKSTGSNLAKAKGEHSLIYMRMLQARVSSRGSD